MKFCEQSGGLCYLQSGLKLVAYTMGSRGSNFLVKCLPFFSGETALVNIKTRTRTNKMILLEMVLMITIAHVSNVPCTGDSVNVLFSPLWQPVLPMVLVKNKVK